MQIGKSVVGICISIMFLISYAQQVQAHLEYEVISTEALAKKIENGDEFSLINVLPQIIHATKHIKGSINIPIGKLESSEKLPRDKHTLLIFYCMGTL